MKWKLILLLTLAGLLMGTATIYFVPAKFEALLGTPVFIICAWFIGRYAGDKYFKHGFISGMLNAIIVTVMKVSLSGVYFSNHPAEAALFGKMSKESGATMQQAMLLMGIFSSVFSGLIMGLFGLIGNKAVRVLQGEKM